MTDILIEPHRIVLDGHAGDKVVCAALSALTETFIASVEELTQDKIKTRVIDGYACIRHEDLTEEGQLLRRSFLLNDGTKIVHRSTACPYSVIPYKILHP